MENFDRILFTADSHGNFNHLFRLIDEYEIKDCLLVSCGDNGEGFVPRKKQLKEFELLNNRFKKRGINYASLRGNHSDKSYFDGSINLSHFELIPDYTYRQINGLTFLFIGGALSIDRLERKEGVSYWKDEVFVLKPELLTQTCDVLVTHSAPSWIGPNDKEGIAYWCQRDETLWEECQEERRLHDELFEIVKPKFSMAGHFHRHYFRVYNGCKARILAELEMIEFINR
jgi:hypothetical protein